MKWRKRKIAILISVFKILRWLGDAITKLMIWLGKKLGETKGGVRVFLFIIFLFLGGLWLGYILGHPAKSSQRALSPAHRLAASNRSVASQAKPKSSQSHQTRQSPQMVPNSKEAKETKEAPSFTNAADNKAGKQSSSQEASPPAKLADPSQVIHPPHQPIEVRRAFPVSEKP